MTSYVIQKEKKKKKIENLNLPIEGFHMNPKLKKHITLIDVNHIVLIPSNLKISMIEKQFNRTFRKLASLVFDVTESDNSTASDCIIALNEVAKVLDMITRKYEKDLQKKDLAKLQKKCLMLENKLKQKLVEIRTNIMLNQMTKQDIYQEEKGRGR